jgi:hypothetical protein
MTEARSFCHEGCIVSQPLVRKEWYHKIAVVIATVLFTSYIAMLFVHLR